MALGVLGFPLGLFWLLKLRARRVEAEDQLDRYEAAYAIRERPLLGRAPAVGKVDGA
jgi:hypothetical protein